jgi:hypothetical protein
MAGDKRCPSCNVPVEFSRMNVWNTDGTISQARNPDHRLFFYDSGGFDRLFANVADIVGVSIEGLVIDSKRKATLDYLTTLLSGLRGALLRTFLRSKAYEMTSKLGALMGYGHYELRDWRRGEFIKVYGENVYCLPLISADLIAIFNYVEGLPADLQTKDYDKGKLITVKRGERFDMGSPSRLDYRKIPHKPGRVNLERCPECDLPIDLRKFSWSLDDGVITDNQSGRSMALMGPNEMDSIFLALEAELGEEVNRAIVEGQCRYVREELQERETSRGGRFLARQLALRGMGNLVRFEMGEGRLRAEVENASPYLMVAGLLKGIFEALAGGRSDCGYRLADDGTLSVEVTLGKPADVGAGTVGKA